MNKLIEKFAALFDNVSKTLPLARIIEVSCYIAGAGAFGVFLRWMQDQLAFNDAGLPEKSAFHVFLPVYLLIAALVLGNFVRRYAKEGLSLPEDFFAAFENKGWLYGVVRWVVGLTMSLGGVVTLMTTELDKHADMLRILAVLAILAGLAYALTLELASRGAANPTLLCALTLFPMALYAFWLIYCYSRNSINGVAWSYMVEVATVCMAMLAFFRVAGFAFAAPSWKRCMFDVSFAAALCLTSLADERYLGMQLILFATALMLLFCNWLMTCALVKTGETPVEPEADDGGFAKL